MDTTTIQNNLKNLISRGKLTPQKALLLFGRPEGLFLEEESDSKRRRGPSRRNEEKDINTLVGEFTANVENLFGDFTCYEMARKLGVTNRALQKYFQNELALDFRSWKSRVKIDAAKELLLEDKSATVSDIAKLFGFSDRSNFHHRFKIVTGYTPTQWRELERN